MTDKSQFVAVKWPTIQIPQNIDMTQATEFKVAEINDKAPVEKVIEAPKRVVQIKPAKEVKLKITNAAPINKVINISMNNENEIKEELASEIKEPTHHKVAFKDKRALSLKMGFGHDGFKVEAPKVESVAMMFESYLDQTSEKLAQINEIPTQEVVAEVKNETENTARVENEYVAYDPMDKEAIENFEQQRLQDIVSKVEASVVEAGSSEEDDLVFIDYSNDKANQTDQVLEESVTEEVEMASPESSIQKVAMAADISSSVRSVIDRELDLNESRNKVVDRNSSYRDLLAESNIAAPVNPLELMKKSVASNSTGNEEESRVSIHAMNAVIGKGIQGNVHNFSMYPAVDNNQIYEDFNEGKIKYDYSLNGKSGILRATLHKNYYVRTTIEVPLTGDYSTVEVPLIDNESLEDYLDEHKLSGYGAYYLVDLGEYVDDVEITSDANQQNSYEHRIYFNEDFKEVKSTESYRYIMFVGVIPGNIRVQYLGVNRQETSRITFAAPDEITFDLAATSPSYEMDYELKLRHTLGKENQVYDISTSKMVSFIGGEQPVQLAPGKYRYTKPWSMKGERTYMEVNHLESPVFVGMARGQTIELPSMEFVAEIFQYLNIDGLNSNECLLQFNLPAKEVANMKIIGENGLGPMSFEQKYLDKDGIFSDYISPKTEKMIILGNEEGIFPMEVTYADGTKDFLRTYCSPGSYLLEQL